MVELTAGISTRQGKLMFEQPRNDIHFLTLLDQESYFVQFLLNRKYFDVNKSNLHGPTLEIGSERLY